MLGEEFRELGGEHLRLEPVNHVPHIGDLDEAMPLDFRDAMLLVLEPEAALACHDEGGSAYRLEELFEYVCLEGPR